jgi:hypothetical protein
MESLVLDSPDERPLSQLENDDFSQLAVRRRGRIFHHQLHVVEKLRVPERHEVPPQRFFAKNVAFSREHARLQSFLANTAISLKLNAHNDDTFRRPARRLPGRSLRTK